MLGSKEGGNERYINELSKALSSFSKIKVYLYVPKEYIQKQVKSDERFFIPSKQNNLRRISFDLESVATKVNADLIHATYVGPFFKKRNLVLTVHDLAFKKFPNLFSAKEKIILNKLMPISLDKADAVITPSKFSKKEVLKFYPRTKGKIFVTYEAASSIFEKQAKKDLKRIQRKWKIKNKYFLLLGGGVPKRKVGMVKEAINSLGHGIDLVVVGNVRGKKESGILYTNFVKDKDLSLLYSGAVSLVYFSVYEGFGLPIIEALKSGTNVIASNLPVFKEVFKDSIFYAKDQKDLVAKMKLVLEGKSKNANDILKKYSWKKTAKETLKVYEEVIGK